MKCCDLTAGMLRTSVALQSQTRTADGVGGYTITWATYATVQAHVRQSSGREAMQADRLQDTAMLRCVIRYRSDVEPQHRVKIGSDVYQIRSIDNIEFRNRWLSLLLEVGVAT